MFIGEAPGEQEDLQGFLSLEPQESSWINFSLQLA